MAGERLKAYKPHELHPGRLTRRRLSDDDRAALVAEFQEELKSAKTWAAAGRGIMTVTLAAAKRAGALQGL